MRSLRLSGGLALLTVLQFFVVERIVAGAWPTAYDFNARNISDLGAVRCHVVDGVKLCSPQHLLMNASFVLTGLAIAVGIWLALMAQAVAVRRASLELGGDVQPVIGSGVLAAYLIGAVGLIGVGLFAEDVVFPLHALAALLFFLGVAAGNIQFGLRLLSADGFTRKMALVADAELHGAEGVPSTLPTLTRLRLFGFLLCGLGAFGLFTAALYLQGIDLTVGGGFVERLSAYSSLAGVAVVGLHELLDSRSQFLKVS